MKDDRGSIPLALLLITVGTMLCALVLPIVITQISATNSSVTTAQELNAAQSGLTVAVGHLRSAFSGTVDGAEKGLISALPCGALSGALASTSSAQYRVSITYLGADPLGQSASWISANTIPCLAGGGTVSTPAFALLRSTGTLKSASRTLQATYVFSTNNANIPGGQIVTSGQCVDAGSASPTVGTLVGLQPCSHSAAQTFSYLTNLSLVLNSSRTTAQPLGLCLDSGTGDSAAAISVQPCATATKPSQVWSYDGLHRFNATADGNVDSGWCLSTVAPSGVAGPGVFLNSCGAGGTVFDPDTTVGAGRAGPALGQLVNYAQYGSCLDVTHQDLSFGEKNYIITYTCKATPNPADTQWNQLWKSPIPSDGTNTVAGNVTTLPNAEESSGDTPGVPYCMYSPLTAGGVVTIQACSSSGTLPNTQWKVYGKTASYNQSYTVVDNAGNCLQANSVNSDGLYPITVATCNGSTAQKWNASPNLGTSPLKDIKEG